MQGEGLVGKGLKWARSDAIQDQSWSRVSCEPYVGYEFNSEPHWCFPDIVIWADDRSRNKGPGGDTSTPWPIAWACELKYGSSNKGEWDVKKLRLLIEQGKIEYGCAINIHFETGADHVSVNWRKEIVNQKRSRRLWVGNVAVPKKPEVA